MEREIIRVEPFDTNFEKWGAPVSVCKPPDSWRKRRYSRYDRI